MKYLYIATLILLVCSCDKEFETDQNNFNVTLLQNPNAAGDTAIFSIEGNPDFITFYSGENGKNFEFRNRLRVESVRPELSFTSYGQNLSAQHPNSLSLLISSDYSGDTLSINNANWTDVTNRLTLSTGTSGTPSGILDLSDFAQSDSVYIAFRYKTAPGATATQPTWTIQSFFLNNVSLPDNSVYNVTTIGVAGWQVTDVSNSANRWVPSSTQLKITGGAANSSANEDWIISKLFLKRVKADVGIPIKTISEKVKEYAYRFSKPGTYTVTFLAGNKRFNTTSEQVRQFTITVN